MRAAWQIHNLCRMEKQEPTPLKKLIRAFFWGNELKAFPLLKSAIFAFPHERHLKPTTATTTWNSKQKPKSAIFCFFSHSFSLKHRQNRGKTFLKHRQNRSETFLKHRQQTAKLPHNWSVVPVLLFVVPVLLEFYSGAAGVLFRCYRSFIPALPEFYYSSAGISIIRSFQTSYHSPRRCIYRQDRAESRPLSIWCRISCRNHWNAASSIESVSIINFSFCLQV